MNKAVFLDKDGTLVPDVPYNVNPKLVSLERNSLDGLQLFHDSGYKLIVISNQSGIARGYFDKKKLSGVEDKIQQLLRVHNLKIDGFYYCPHDTDDVCDCRKPKPGLILKAAQDFNIDLAQSWMIGDILNDVEAGNRAGCKTILIDNGNETEWVINENREPFFKAININEAALLIQTTSKEANSEAIQLNE
ncbi:MAG TPA: HAD family hydrolase [Pedobacter sp.]|jgi:histidinol-phosphate phosphatase family protein